MAINNFESHLISIGNALEQFNEVKKELFGLLEVHTHNAYDTLVSGSYAGLVVNKTQYDNAMVSITDLLNTWVVAGHGTNIDNYLFEKPE